jgi:hypothetical protein
MDDPWDNSALRANWQARWNSSIRASILGDTPIS